MHMRTFSGANSSQDWLHEHVTAACVHQQALQVHVPNCDRDHDHHWVQCTVFVICMKSDEIDQAA